MLDRFVHAIFGELDCVLDISAGGDSRAGRTKLLPRSFLTCRNRFPLAERNGGQSAIASGTANPGATAASPGWYSPAHQDAAGKRLTTGLAVGDDCMQKVPVWSAGVSPGRLALR